MSIQPVTADVASPTLAAIAQFVKDISKRRSERLALNELLTMAPHRLDDLGIDLGDILEAIHCLSQAGQILEERRAARADRRTHS